MNEIRTDRTVARLWWAWLVVIAAVIADHQLTNPTAASALPFG